MNSSKNATFFNNATSLNVKNLAAVDLKAWLELDVDMAATVRVAHDR
jgi:hypothetical protein